MEFTGVDVGSMIYEFLFVIQRSDRLACRNLFLEKFVDGGPVTLVLGDNIFEDDFQRRYNLFNLSADSSKKKWQTPSSGSD